MIGRKPYAARSRAVRGRQLEEARILFEAVPEKDYLVELQRAGRLVKKQMLRSQEEGSAMPVFTGLPANTHFNYSIQTEDGAKLDAVPKPSFATFPLPGEDASLCFAFFSCHRPFEQETTWAWEKGK